MNHFDGERRWLHAALALGGETGEILELIKKGDRYGLVAINAIKLFDELGDVLWAVSTLAQLAEADLSTVIAANSAKLNLRHINTGGWTDAGR